MTFGIDLENHAAGENLRIHLVFGNNYLFIYWLSEAF